MDFLIFATTFRLRPSRVRHKGGGRKKKTFEDPTLTTDLKGLVETTTRGDPTQPLLWTTRSLRNLVKQLLSRVSLDSF
jgi:hypothetical protein